MSVICVCQSKLTKVRASDAYGPHSSVYCDQCRKCIRGNKSVYHCGKNSFHPHGYDLCLDCIKKSEARRMTTWVQENADNEQDQIHLVAKLVTLDLADDEKGQLKDVAYVPSSDKVASSRNTNDIVLTYFHGTNKYWFHVEKRPFANGFFKLSYRGTLYKSEKCTNSLVGTPAIGDGTSVVLKVKHREHAHEASRRRYIMKRREWSNDLKELSRLRQYANEWNKNAFSDKTYHVSQACVLKVSGEGKDGTGPFLKDEYVLVEPFMPHFEKWNWPKNAERFAKAFSVQAFGHFTYHCSHGRELVNDAQGYRDNNKYILTDPYYVDGSDAMCKEWFQNHECNKFCKKTWKRPKGVVKRQLRSNFAYGRRNNERSVTPTAF